MLHDKTKIALVSLGCDKNLVDSEVMTGLLREDGYEMTADIKTAEAIILNTCGFLEEAVAEAFDTALSLLEYKKENIGVCKAFIMTGCLVSRYKDEIFEYIPGVDAIIGAADYDAINRAAAEALKGRKKLSFITDINRNVPEEARQKRVVSTPKHYAYLKISEGCDNCCTYCAIPFIRGKYRSRGIEVLVDEAERLALSGVKELILVAQDTSLYGQDIYGKPSLDELLRKLSEIDGIVWIRILYCYPEHITEELIAEISRNPKICHYIDMPIQHCSDDVLRKMGRKGGKALISEVVNKLRAAIPDISLRTTLIAGFPGETVKNFNELMESIKEIKFDRLGVFAYSKEEGTPAAGFDKQIGKKEREKRADALMEVQEEIIVAKNEAKIGKIFKTIIDEKLEDDPVYCGRTYSDAPGIDTLVYIEESGELEIGAFVNVKITEADVYDLVGVVADEV